MCGGGGGGDGGAAAREKAREKRIAEAVSQLNIQFGNMNITPPQQSDYQIPHEGPHGSTYTTPDTQAYEEALKRYEESRAQAEANNATREQSYTDSSNTLREYLLKQLQDRAQDADRSRRFNVARRGVTGGSSDIDIQADQAEKEQQAALKIGDRADALKTDLRSSDEATRLDLIGLVHSGMSAQDAIANAIQRMQNNIDNARSSVSANTLGDVFGTLGDYNTSQSQQRGRDRAIKDYYGTYIPNNSSYGGSVN